MKPLGDGFVKLIKMIIAPVIFCTVVTGIAGVALAAVLEGLTSGIALLNPDVYDQLRFWQAGSLDIRNLHTLKVVLIPVLIAGATALLLSRVRHHRLKIRHRHA